MALIAQADPVAVQIWSVVIGSVITAICGGTVLVLNSWWGNKRTIRADSLKEWQDAAQMHKTASEELRKTLTESVARSAVLEYRAVRAETRIELLEDALRRAGIEFRPYFPPAIPEGGSK